MTDQASDRLPRREYLPREAALAAYMAGSGSSAEEIAEVLGGTTRARVRALLKSYGLDFVPKTGQEVAFPVVVSVAALREAEKIADVRRLDPKWMMSRVLDLVLKDQALLLDLLNDL